MRDYALYLAVSFARIASLRSERSLAINGGVELAAVELHRTERKPSRDENRVALNIIAQLTQ
jgi:hypothetical protein